MKKAAKSKKSKTTKKAKDARLKRIYHFLSVLVVVGVFAVIGATILPSSDAALKKQPQKAIKKVMIIGDSMTARNLEEPQKYGKGWWGYIKDDTSANLVFSAQGGSGYIRRGNNPQGDGGLCKGTSFEQRLNDIYGYQPNFIIIAGGFNDGGFCNANNNRVPATPAEIRAGITNYYNRFENHIQKAGIPARNVYVFTPWGPEGMSRRNIVEPIVKEQAERIGANYVYVPSLDPGQSYDSIHPTPAGARFLYNKFVQNSNFLSRF